MEFVIYNGQQMLVDDLKLSINNRALLYADGFFETIVAHQLELRFIEDHWCRITQAAAAHQIELNADFDLDFLNSGIKRLLESNGLPHAARVKILIWRAGEGLYTPTSNAMEYMITTAACNKAPLVKKKVEIYQHGYKPSSFLSPYKSLANVAIYVHAAMRKKKMQADDLIILDKDGNIAECISSNIFFITNNQIITPPITSGCINGIARQQILKLATQMQIQMLEKEIAVDDLKEMQLAFTANVTGVSVIGQIRNQPYALTHPFLQNIQQLLTIPE